MYHALLGVHAHRVPIGACYSDGMPDSRLYFSSPPPSFSSGGIYAGESQPQITADYPALVAELVAENNYAQIEQVVLSV